MNLLRKIGNIADQNKMIGIIRYQYKRIVYLPRYIRALYGIRRRSRGYIDNRFIKLRDLKNTHLGERCFIVATGPSLTISDVEMLKNEFTFGVNSISKIGDKTSWRPTYLGIQDPFVYEKIEKSIIDNYDDNVFVADYLTEKFDIPERFILFPYLAINKRYMNKFNEYNTVFSDDAYKIVYDGYSITYSMIEIAVYMGFKEIYLLGCDCNYPKGEINHFIESGFVDKNAYLNGVKMMAGYNVVKQYADAHDIKVVNCTRGGMLEVFQRMELEDVLKGV